jgi:hypothetical protein
MPRVGFEPTMGVFEPPKTIHATVIGISFHTLPHSPLGALGSERAHVGPNEECKEEGRVRYVGSTGGKHAIRR